MGGAGGDGPKEPVSFTTQVLAFCAFAIGNVGLNYFNSWALRQAEVPGLGKGDFNFPFFYTMFHMVASAIACALLLNCCGAAKEGAAPSFALLWEYKWQILPISICTVLGTALNNWSLTLVALFVNQVIKSCVPAVTCAFEFVWLRKIVSWKIYLLVLCICGGSVLTQVDNFDGASSTIVGIVVCAIAICAASARGVLQKAITSGTPGVEPLQPLVVLMWDASFSAVILFFIWVFSDERGRSIDYLLGRTANELSGLLAAGIISFGSALAFTHNIANYYYIMWTSALTMAIGGNGIKIFLLCGACARARALAAFPLTRLLSPPTQTVTCGRRVVPPQYPPSPTV